jgi:predicted DsbA family dithiol-disulfide isomerase
MHKLDVFFDPTCPFCYRGHAYLMELLAEFPGVEPVWRPVEAHPRAEEPWHRPYIDLGVKGALFLRANGVADELPYYEALYRACFEERKDVEDVAVLAGCAAVCLAASGLSGDVAESMAALFEDALRSGALEQELQAANDYAYELNKVWAVPSFVCGERRLDSVGGVGVTKKQLRAFLSDLA